MQATFSQADRGYCPAAVSAQSASREGVGTELSSRAAFATPRHRVHIESPGHQLELPDPSSDGVARGPGLLSLYDGHRGPIRVGSAGLCRRHPRYRFPLPEPELRPQRCPGRLG